ncbi:MAG: GAF domain-containing sensor histidine kinase [Chloroflexi bacterium]|nr:GAF domain-containing sensor histidine kinase [Chloroflexota bacterium]
MTNQSNNVEQARLAALYEVSSQLGASLDLGEVLNQVMDAIILLTGAERGFLMLFDDATGQLHTEAARNVDRETIEGASMQISRTVLQRAATTGDAILTSNAQEDERFSDQQSVIGYQLRSIMCAPLRARARIIGAVYVDNRLFSGVFKEADLELLGTFANQSAIAIDNARLFTQTDHALARRVEELTVFQQIDQQLNRSLELNQVLSSAVTWALAMTTADSGSIGLLAETEEGQVLRLLVTSGAPAQQRRSSVALDHPVLAQVLAMGQSVLLEQVSKAEAIDGRATAAQLAVPIKQDGRVAGLITLASQNPQTITDEDVAFVERLADRAAVAIKNARLYEAIQAANKAKSDFVSVVTHELRLPMTSIKGYTDLIMSGMTGELNEQQKQFLGVIKRNLERMSVLIRDLSDINHMESGRMQFEMAVFDAREVVEEVADNFRQQLTAREQSLEVVVAEGNTAVSADPRRISQVLTNLVSNAHKYTPAYGRITIHVQPQEGCVEIAVQDNGIGVSEENQARLFTQFFRAEDEAVREQVGWGLGLSIVKKMVEAQGGGIRFHSVYGQGSAFAFTIPSANITRELE